MIDKGCSKPVQIKGEAGDLHGYFHKGNPEKATGGIVLFLSGSGFSTEEQSLDIATSYTHHGVDVLTINYRGYGQSSGAPSEKGMYNDANAMLSYLVDEKNIPPENILIHGYSLGAPVGAYLAKSASSKGMTLAGVLLDRPMPSMSKGCRAHEVPAEKIVGQIAKKMNGVFSVKENITGLPKDTPMMLLSDSEKMGAESEKLRTALSLEGYKVSGTRTAFKHDDSIGVIHENIDNILKEFKLG